MYRLLASLLLALGLAAGASAQDARFEGRVTDEAGAPLVGAAVLLDGTVFGASTDVEGRYGFSAPAGTYTIAVSFLGYGNGAREVTAAAGQTVAADFRLAEAAAEVGEVIVTGASRRPERVVESPSTISVVTGAELDALPGVGYEEALARVKGVDFVRSGITGVGINARGFNSAFNTKMLLLTDGRRQMLPGAGLPFAAMNPVIKEDVERVEVILGPSSALYGANAHNGIVNVVTKDPRNSPGLTLVASGGGGGEESSVGSVRGRYAQAFLGNRVAVKATGEYTRGEDYAFADTVYVNAPVPTAEPADFTVEHGRGTAELYVSPAPGLDVIGAYAGSVNSYLGPTNLGRNQVQDWTLHQLQLRAVHPRFFGQVYQTWSNSGDTYALQNYVPFLAAGLSEADAVEAARFIDESRRFNAELQGNVEGAAGPVGLRLIAGGAYELETAVSQGSYLSDTTGVGLEFEQVGLSAQAEASVGPVRLVAAGRFDSQTNYGERFSPKVGVVVSPSPSGSFRLTYGEAFVAPTVLQQEIFLPLGPGVVARGNSGGFTILNADGSTSEVAPVEPEDVQTVEAGYRGLVAPSLFLDVNAYRSRSENFITPLGVAGLATAVGGRPLAAPEVVLTYQNFGEVTNLGADLSVTYLVSDRVTATATYSTFSADLDDASFDLNDDGVVSPDEASVNTPGHKGSLSLTARDFGARGLTGSVTVRGVSEYDFVSGRHFAADAQEGQRVLLETPGGVVPFNYNYGPLGGFVTTSVSAGYRFTDALSLGLSVTNLFGVEQREFVAAAPTPRFFQATLRTDLPAFGN
jgi:iron complex outermembrane receptor protein